MILQELYKYYERNKTILSPLGFEKQKVRFTIVLALDGSLVGVEDRQIEEIQGKKKNKYIPMLESPEMPERSGTTSYKQVGFVAEKTEYVLGFLPEINTPKHALSYETKLEDCFKETHDESIKAILNFLQKLKSNEIDKSKLSEVLNEVKNKPIISFLIDAHLEEVWERDAVSNWYTNQQTFIEDEESENEKGSKVKNDPIYGQCLISGEQGILARLHPKLKKNRIGNKNNAGLVAYNEPAFCSYGKEQSYNAPVSIDAVKGYGITLKHLFSTDSTHKLRIGDATASFWAEKSTEFESVFSSYFEDENEISKEEKYEEKKEAEAKAVKDAKLIHKTPESGQRKTLDRYNEDNTKFFVLGLSPNSARLSVRFWYQGSIAQTVQKLQEHFSDLEIVHGTNDTDVVPLKRLLSSTAFEADYDKIQPKLIGDMLKAILNGTRYPRTLLQSVINRIKAEQAKKDDKGKQVENVSYKRASLIKAFLNRQRRLSDRKEYEEIKKTMDESNTNTAYRLGRLFAVLERLQEKAQPGINATIRDRFYGAASSCPITVFGRLIKLSNHHLEKLEGGLKGWFSKQIGEIAKPINEFPSHFNLEEQGLFALGYYHQRQSFFERNSDTVETGKEVVNV